MRILISGSTGFIGQALVRESKARGHDVMRLVRANSRHVSLDDGTTYATWDPRNGTIDRDLISGIDAVVHLAGESIAEGRWSPEKKRKIFDSRVAGTQLLAGAIAALPIKPRVLVSMSAIGFYGVRGETALDETSEKGEGFLADVAQAWEQAAQPAADAGVRVVYPRLGMVLAKQGGVLARLLPFFRWGLGGVAGTGDQYWSWVSMGDTMRALHFMIEEESMSGPVNLVSPQPVTNREFTRALGRAVRRPTVLPTPGWVLRLMAGEMADTMALGSTRVFPKQLLDAGFVFEDPELDEALRSGIKS